MKNYYYCLDLNLQNSTVKKYLQNNKSGKLSCNNDSNTMMTIVSRYFTDRNCAVESLQNDMYEKTTLLKINKIFAIALNETNPHYTNPKEELEKARMENPELENYLDTWEEGEISRLTCTSESIEDDEFPICEDKAAIIFKYSLMEFEDDFKVPYGLLLTPFESTAIH